MSLRRAPRISKRISRFARISDVRLSPKARSTVCSIDEVLAKLFRLTSFNESRLNCTAIRQGMAPRLSRAISSLSAKTMSECLEVMARSPRYSFSPSMKLSWSIMM